MGFGKAKCIFNNTYYMNATIMDTDEIKCDSPALSTEEGALIFSNATSAPWYNISITLNGREYVPVKGRFSYYIDPTIKSITPNIGPLSGGTVSKISGNGFAQDGVCNVTVRYGALN
jgi:IPT/TIG domain